MDFKRKAGRVSRLRTGSRQRRWFLLGIYGMLLCFTGCASVKPVQKPVIVQSTIPNYHWSNPIVQDVKVPAHISNGVFLPEHKELVIIKPGEWAKSPAYPIGSQEEKYENTKQDVDMDVDTADITHLPNSERAEENSK